MKRLTPIAAIAAASMLLEGCQSKREICAQWNVLHYTEMNKPAVAKSYWKKLGIKGEATTELPITYRWRNGVTSYCEFYKN